MNCVRRKILIFILSLETLSLSACDRGNFGKLGKGEYTEMEKQYLAWNEVELSYARPLLGLDDDMKQWLKVFDHYCIEKNYHIEMCKEKIEEYKRVRAGLLAAAEQKKSSADKSRREKAESLGFGKEFQDSYKDRAPSAQK